MTNDIQWPAWQDVPFTLPARNEERLLIAVDVEPISTSVGEQHTERGLQFRVIYKSQLPAVQKLVRTDVHRQMLAQAQAQYDYALVEHAKENHRGNVDAARETFGLSPQSIYGNLPGGKRGVPPLLSLAVHPDTVPAPHTPESAAEQQSSALVKALQEVVRAGQRADKKSNG